MIKTLTENYCEAKPLSKFGLLVFLSVDLKLKSLGEGLLESIFSEISSGAANRQNWSRVSIYSRSLPRWDITKLDIGISQWTNDMSPTVGFEHNGNDDPQVYGINCSSFRLVRVSNPTRSGRK